MGGMWGGKKSGKKMPLHHFLYLQFSFIKGAGNASSCSDLIYVPVVACAV